jgi:hypothetical protein
MKLIITVRVQYTSHISIFYKDSEGSCKPLNKVTLKMYQCEWNLYMKTTIHRSVTHQVSLTFVKRLKRYMQKLISVLNKLRLITHMVIIA